MLIIFRNRDAQEVTGTHNTLAKHGIAEQRKIKGVLTEHSKQILTVEKDVTDMRARASKCSLDDDSEMKEVLANLDEAAKGVACLKNLNKLLLQSTPATSKLMDAVAECLVLGIPIGMVYLVKDFDLSTLDALQYNDFTRLLSYVVG